LRNDDWTKVLGWPGYRVYRSEIDEDAKTLKLWIRRKRREAGVLWLWAHGGGDCGNQRA